jgi:HEAT repeat protein
VNRKALAVTLLVLAAGAVALVLWMQTRRAEFPEATPPADSAAIGRRTRQPQGPPDEATISRLMRDSLWQRRASTAWGLTERPDIPVERRAVLLLDILKREVTSPTNALRLEGSYLPMTSFLRIHYLHALETLGPQARAPVREAYEKSQGEVREWYSLALGATTTPEAAAPLRELVIKSRNVEVRMTAARYLGWLKDREAVPALRAALNDTATAMVTSDFVGLPRRRFYPVREQAAGALKELGLQVKRQGDTYLAQ